MDAPPNPRDRSRLRPSDLGSTGLLAGFSAGFRGSAPDAAAIVPRRPAPPIGARPLAPTPARVRTAFPPPPPARLDETGQPHPARDSDPTRPRPSGRWQARSECHHPRVGRPAPPCQASAPGHPARRRHDNPLHGARRSGTMT